MPGATGRDGMVVGAGTAAAAGAAAGGVGARAGVGVPAGVGAQAGSGFLVGAGPGARAPSPTPLSRHLCSSSSPSMRINAAKWITRNQPLIADCRPLILGRARSRSRSCAARSIEPRLALQQQPASAPLACTPEATSAGSDILSGAIYSF